MRLCPRWSGALSCVCETATAISLGWRYFHLVIRLIGDDRLAAALPEEDECQTHQYRHNDDAKRPALPFVVGHATAP